MRKQAAGNPLRTPACICRRIRLASSPCQHETARQSVCRIARIPPCSTRNRELHSKTHLTLSRCRPRGTVLISMRYSCKSVCAQPLSNFRPVQPHQRVREGTAILQQQKQLRFKLNNDAALFAGQVKHLRSGRVSRPDPNREYFEVYRLDPTRSARF